MGSLGDLQHDLCCSMYPWEACKGRGREVGKLAAVMKLFRAK